MKAIIEVAKRGSVMSTARQQLIESLQGKPVNFRLSFESATSLFKELTATRFTLLDTLSKAGSCSVYALAKAAGRNYSNVHSDVLRLEELGLIERTEEGTIFVPFYSVEILMSLAKAA